MRILHVFANWKWTGPAEPALNLAWKQREAGHAVVFLSGEAPEGQDSRIEPQAAARGVETRNGFHLSKHARLRANRADATRLADLLAAWRPDIVHAHLDNDHRIASMAVARTGIGRLVRTAYDAHGLPRTLRLRRVARRALDGLVVVTRSGLRGTLAAWGGETEPNGGQGAVGDRAGEAVPGNGDPPERRSFPRRGSLLVAGRPRPLALIEGGVDLARFDASRLDRAAARSRLGLAPDAVAIGIVARVQAHRRFDVLIEALARAAEAHPALRLVVIGRGTRIRALLIEPIEARGLSRQLVATGYLAGDDFVAALAALDASLYLVPGSDGTCRALREQMAMGLAPVVTPRAPLPDLVEHGRTGLVVPESVEGLAGALGLLAGDAARREAMRAAARAEARRRFDLEAQAREVLDFYGRVLGVAS